jgi:hypothetical protein
MATDLVPFESYEIAGVDARQLIEAISANLGGQKLSERDLDVVKMPTGGSTFWEVPDLEGVKPEPVIRGVLVHHKLIRAFWKESLDEGQGGQPPDCHSPDSEWGYGDPGDALRAESKGCDDCPMSQFGSDEKGRGQACTQSHLMFLVKPEELLPVVVRLSPMSLQIARKFMSRLSSKAVPYWSVVVEIGLEQAQNATGDKYAKATFKVTERLQPEQAAKVKELGDTLRPLFDQAAAAQASERPAAEEPAAEPEGGE